MNQKSKPGKGTVQRIATGVSVGLATSGLSSCTDNGAVDPVPPPFTCSTDIATGQNLEATVAIDGTDVTVVLRALYTPPPHWVEAQVANVVNASLTSVTVDALIQQVVIHLELDSEDVAAASFEFSGEVMVAATSCAVHRNFAVVVEGPTIVLQETSALPLASRDTPTIEAVAWEGRAIELRARSRYDGPHSIDWEATAGSLDRLARDRVRWSVPAAPGLYQVEVVMDYGEDGLGFDSFAVEVVEGEDAGPEVRTV